MGDIGKSMARGDTLGCEKEIFQTEGDIEVNGEGIKENMNRVTSDIKRGSPCGG